MTIAGTCWPVLIRDCQYLSLVYAHALHPPNEQQVGLNNVQGILNDPPQSSKVRSRTTARTFEHKLCSSINLKILLDVVSHTFQHTPWVHKCMLVAAARKLQWSVHWAAHMQL